MEDKKYKNHLGIVGWAAGGSWGLERYLYLAHRITGLGILFFFLLHIFMSSTRMYGGESWTEAMKTLKNPLLNLGEFVVFTAFAFHALNGIRLILIELGFAVGKAEEPIFPYRSSIDDQRPLMKIVMAIAAVLVFFGGINALFMGH